MNNSANTLIEADSKPKHLNLFQHSHRGFFWQSLKCTSSFSGFRNCNLCTAHSTTLRGVGDAGKNILSLEKGPRGVDPVISIVVAQPHEPLSSPPPLPSLPRQLPLNCPASRLFRDSKGFALRIERAGGTLKSVLAPS